MALKADYIVRSQRVFTSAPGAASARPLAFAVAADRIAYVDEFDRVQAEAGPGTPVVDLGGAPVFMTRTCISSIPRWEARPTC